MCNYSFNICLLIEEIKQIFTLFNIKDKNKIYNQCVYFVHGYNIA